MVALEDDSDKIIPASAQKSGGRKKNRTSKTQRGSKTSPKRRPPKPKTDNVPQNGSQSEKPAEVPSQASEAEEVSEPASNFSVTYSDPPQDAAGTSELQETGPQRVPMSGGLGTAPVLEQDETSEDNTNTETAENYPSQETNILQNVVVPDKEVDIEDPPSTKERVKRAVGSHTFLRAFSVVLLIAAIVLLWYALGWGNSGLSKSVLSMMPKLTSTSSSTSTSTSLPTTLASTSTSTLSTTTVPAVVAQSATQYPGMGGTVIGVLCSVYTTVHSVIFLLGLVLLLFGAAMYAAGHSMPGSLKNQFMGYGTNMISGAMAGVVLALVVPYFLQIAVNGALPIVSCG